MFYQAADGQSVELIFEHAGLFETTEAWIHSVRTIASYEVILVLQGVMYLREGETRHEIGPGEALLLRPGV